MATTGDGTEHCGKPDCDREAEETYEGPNGNTVPVCGMHYYKLVTWRTSKWSPTGLGTDITPDPTPEGGTPNVTPNPKPDPTPDPTPDITPDTTPDFTPDQ